MKRIFSSIQFPDGYGYAFDSEAFDYKAPMEEHFRQFHTYGDGLCQHSGDWSISKEQFTDYLASLAVEMLKDLTNPEIGEASLLQRVAWIIGNRPDVRAMEFAASVVYVEGGKTRYYSISERKVSSAPTKEYDKRYAKVEPWNDGGVDAIYRMLIPEYAHGVLCYCYASAIRDYFISSGHGYSELPAVFLKWEEDPDAARKMRDAYEACWSLVEAFRLRELAQSHLENLKRSLPKTEAVQP